MKIETYQCQSLSINCNNYDNLAYDGCNLQCVSNEVNSRTCYGVTFYGFNRVNSNPNMTINCISNIDGYSDIYACYSIDVYSYNANQVNVFTNAYYGMYVSRFYAYSTKQLIITVNGTYAD